MAGIALISSDSNAGTGAPASNRRLPILSLLAIAVLSVPVFCTRFLNDMDYYSLVSDKLLAGGVLYRDAIDTKPPLVFLHYALAFKAFGHDNVTAIKIVTMVWLAISAFAMTGIRKALCPASKAPQLAALLFVLASFSGWGEDFLSSNTEMLSNLFVLLAVWCMVADDFSDRVHHLAGAGVLVGVGFLYRYQAAAPIAAYALTLVTSRRRADRMVRRLMFLGMGFLMPIGAFVGYYASIGSLPALGLLLRYQSYYVRGHELYWPQVFGQIGIVIASQWPFLMLAGSQVARMLRAPTWSRGEHFLIWFLIFSVAPFFVGGHYFAHYVVQAIPALALLTAEWLSGARGVLVGRAATLIVANVVVFLILNTAFYSLRPPGEPIPNLVRFARERTNPRDAVFVWTWRSHLLFEIDRVFATRFLSNELLIGRLYTTRYRLPTATADAARAAAVPELWPLLMNDLRSSIPRLIVDDVNERSNFTIDHYPELDAFVKAYYEPCQVMDDFCVYVRRGN